MKHQLFLPVALGASLLLGGPLVLQAEAKDRDHRNHRHDRHRSHHYHSYHRGPSSGFVFQFDLSPRTVYRAPTYGYSRNVVADVQVALNRRGYGAGPADGVIGYRTRSAIRAYQADRGLYVTGTINDPLLRSLRLR